MRDICCTSCGDRMEIFTGTLNGDLTVFQNLRLWVRVAITTHAHATSRHRSLFRAEHRIVLTRAPYRFCGLPLQTLGRRLKCTVIGLLSSYRGLHSSTVNVPLILLLLPLSYLRRARSVAARICVHGRVHERSLRVRWGYLHLLVCRMLSSTHLTVFRKSII